MVTTLNPRCRDNPFTSHCVVPDAVPLPPLEFRHVTRLIPTLSKALPATFMLFFREKNKKMGGEGFVNVGGSRVK